MADSENYVPTVLMRDFEQHWAHFERELVEPFASNPAAKERLKETVQRSFRSGFLAGAQFVHGVMCDGMSAAAHRAKELLRAEIGT